MKMSIKSKLILFTILPIIVLLSVTTILNYNYSTKTESTHTDKLMTHYTQEFAHNINNEMQYIENIALSGQEFLELQDFLTEKDIFTFLSNNINKNKLIIGSRLLLIDNLQLNRNVSYLVSKTQDSILKHKIVNINQSEIDTSSWFQIPFTTGKSYWDEPFIDIESNRICTRVNVPLYKNNKFIGISSVRIDLTRFKYFVDTTLFSSFNFVIISSKGQYIYHPSKRRIYKDNMLTIKGSSLNSELLKIQGQKMIAGEQGKIEINYLDIKDKFLWAYYFPIKSTKWSVSIGVDKDEVLASSITNLRISIAIYTIAMLIIIAIIIVVSNKIINPLKTLSDRIQYVSSNQNYELITIQSNDEIGELASYFNVMLEKIENREQELKNFNTRLEYAFQATSDAIFEWNIKKHALYFSEKMYDIFDYDVNEFEPNMDIWFELTTVDYGDSIPEQIFGISQIQDNGTFESLGIKKKWR